MTYKYTLSQNCPNLDLANANFDNYFRLIKAQVPQNIDFVPHYFLPKFTNKDWGKSLCSAQGVSLFGKMSDVKMLIESLPNITKQYSSVFSGQIDSIDGSVLKTPSRTKPSHCDFYAYKTCDETSLFKEKEFEI